VVVDFSGGPLQITDADATDVMPGDGTARVDVRGPAVRTRAIDRSAAGVRARVVQATGRLVIRLQAARRAFKYLRVSALHRPERLVIDLLGARPPSRAAEIRAGRNGCLRLASVTAGVRGFRVRGVERELYEGSFVLRVRDAAGRAVGRRIMTARGGWSARVAYRVGRAQPGTLEAVAASAKDGSLDCLAQVRVGLRA
jgi:hypothetical protein